MPASFPYILALMAYLAIACGIWIAAIFLAIPQRTRMFAKKIAAGMAGSFPGVFLFQLLSALPIALLLLVISGISHVVKPPDIILIFITLLIISIPAVASLLGFYTGWRVAWELAAGRSGRAFLATDSVLGPIVRFLHQRIPFSKKVL